MSTQTETPGGAAAEEPTEKKLSEEEFVRWIRSTPRSPDRDVVLTTPLTTPHARLKRIQRRYFEEVAKKFERQRMIELEWVAAIDNWCVLLVGALSHPDSQTLTRVVVRCARLLVFQLLRDARDDDSWHGETQETSLHRPGLVGRNASSD